MDGEDGGRLRLCVADYEGGEGKNGNLSKRFLGHRKNLPESVPGQYNAKGV